MTYETIAWSFKWCPIHLKYAHSITFFLWSVVVRILIRCDVGLTHFFRVLGHHRNWHKYMIHGPLIAEPKVLWNAFNSIGDDMLRVRVVFFISLSSHKTTFVIWSHNIRLTIWHIFFFLPSLSLLYIDDEYYPNWKMGQNRSRWPNFKWFNFFNPSFFLAGSISSFLFHSSPALDLITANSFFFCSLFKILCVP